MPIEAALIKPVVDVLMGLFISVPPGHVACVYDRGRGVL